MKNKNKRKDVLRLEKYLTKEFLEEALKKYSANYIARKYFYPEFQTHAGTVINYAKKFGIKTHSISEANSLKDGQKRRKEALKEKYGHENVSQIQFVKDKKVARAIEKYGCVNVFQSEEIKEKSKKTMLKKYDVDHPTQLSSYKRNMGTMSAIHKDISRLLTLNNINHKNEHIFSKFSKIKKKTYSPRADIIIEDKKIVIEVNGDIWHANPLKYKANDEINLFKGLTKAKDIWKRDKIKKNHIESFGYKVIYVWEGDLNSNKQKTYQRLLDEINSN